MAITVDWANAIVNVPRADMLLVQTTPVEIRDLDLNEFRVALKALEASPEGMGFQKIIDHYTAVQVGGIELAHVLILLAPYTVTFEDGQYAVNLTSANSNVGDRVNVNQVSVRSANSAGLAQTKDIEYASFNQAVHIDEIFGNDIWKGNAQFPVKTAARAVEVLNYRGLNKVHVHSTMSFGPDAQFPACTIYGLSKLITLLTVQPGANVDHCTFENLTLSGTLDQNVMLQQCVIENLDYVEGDIHSCEITGVLKVAGQRGLEVFNSYSGRQGTADPAIIDMDGPNTGAKNVAIHNWSGHIKVRNMTGGYFGIACIGGGHVRVESSCTGGMIHVMGNFKLINQAAGATVLTHYMTDPATMAATLLARQVDGVTLQQLFTDLHQGTGGGGGGVVDPTAVWEELVPNGFIEGSAGWALGQVNELVSSFQKSLEGLLARSYQAGLVSVPTASAPGEDLTLFTNTDYDDITLTIGPQWADYLNELSAEVWFTVKSSPRQTVALIDVEARIANSNQGLIMLDLTASHLAKPPGTYFWQLQIRNTSLEVEKRIAMEGTVYLKPSFKA